MTPKGANWQVLAFLPWTQRLQSASIFATFTRDKQLRVELYLDSGDRDENKTRFDTLFARKNEIETAVGEPLSWERRDESLACRIALYTQAQIGQAIEDPAILEWAVQKATALFKAFSPEFTTRPDL
jgi:hypothetical protein